MAHDQYIDYTVPGSPRVNQKKLTCYYYEDDQALYAILDTFSNGYRWQLLDSWVNDSNAEIIETTTITTELKVTENHELDSSWNIGVEFKGMTVGIGGEDKTFEEYETTTTKSFSQQVTIPANSTAYVYQKVYRFQETMWFILDAWNGLHVVGGHNNYTWSTVEGEVEIAAHEYYIRTEKLDHGSSTTTADGVPDNSVWDDVRKFENCTKYCKDYLLERGVRPPNSAGNSQAAMSAEDKHGGKEQGTGA